MTKCVVTFFILVLKSHWIYINSKSWEVYKHILLGVSGKDTGESFQAS